MFTFLTRLGRLGITITVLVAVATILGVTTWGRQQLVASHHQAASPSAACAVSSAGVGQQLVVSGHGFAPSTQYLLNVTTPSGNWATVANTDSSGAFKYTNWTYLRGTYGATAWTEGGGSKQVATCSSLTL